MTTSPVSEGQQTYYILNCHHCMWTTLDIGIRFEKSTNIRGQLDKIANGGKPKSPSRADVADPSRKSSLAREPFSPSATEPSDPIEQAILPSGPLDPHARFSALKQFYKDQITLSTSTDIATSSSLDLGAYSSPSSLARIMNIYTNLGSTSSSLLKKSRQKPQPMREALTSTEGLSLPSEYLTSETDPNLPFIPYISSSTQSQRLHQYAPGLGDPYSRSVNTLRPVPTLLRTKRAKRCLACKHILTKPEIKPTSTRYRLRLLAASYVPLVSLKALPNQTHGVVGKSLGSDGGEVILKPGVPSQWVLRMTNPLFERVKVSLGCPAVVEGNIDKRGRWRQDRVTILCPQFDIGANGDVWDDALDAAKKVVMSPTGGSVEGVAGKVYESGKNWVGVVIEIEPGFDSPSLRRNTGVDGELREGEEDTHEGDSVINDVIEIPIRVRLEWTVGETDTSKGRNDAKKASQKLLDERPDDADDLEDQGRRELAYWMVLGVGRVDSRGKSDAEYVT